MSAQGYSYLSLADISSYGDYGYPDGYRDWADVFYMYDVDYAYANYGLLYPYGDLNADCTVTGEDWNIFFSNF